MALKFFYILVRVTFPWQSSQWHDSATSRGTFFFTFMWPCIVTNFFVIKPTRCTNFTNLFWHETTYFGQFLCPLSGVYSLYTRQWYMSYRFVDRFPAGPGWTCSSILALLYLTTHNTHKRQASMPPPGFEPADLLLRLRDRWDRYEAETNKRTVFIHESRRQRYNWR
jgi:hypothetical protein